MGDFMGELKGIQNMSKKDGTVYYRASLTYKNKHISLGSYLTKELATKAYKEAADIIFEKKYNLIDYNDKFILSYEKWVILHNFRDNNYYIGNPIYMYKSYFSYFFSEDIEFKFNAEDLFFYATHKINARNGYFYINDHGQQINLLTRYNIKNYAVLGKDYNFKNGDCYDFRIRNIEIYNKYNGVKRKIQKGKIKYYTKIYYNGSILVGIYDDEIEAAVAYNKALDLLSSLGINREESKNYILDLSSEEYKQIYKKVKISKNIILRSKQNRPMRFDEYTGVHREKSGFRAYIGYKYKHIYLGMYPTAMQAAQAYNQAAIILYGEKAVLNHTFPTINQHDTEKIKQKIDKVLEKGEKDNVDS